MTQTKKTTPLDSTTETEPLHIVRSLSVGDVDALSDSLSVLALLKKTLCHGEHQIELDAKSQEGLSVMLDYIEMNVSLAVN